MRKVEIDKGSGFCFGVTTAISKAEEELAKGETLYCLGDIVHNGQECERLEQLGLISIDHQQFSELKNAKVLLRAHGEPPSTYRLAEENHITLIDATCPVVLRLQKRIKQEFDTANAEGREKQIVIFGKNGHAEVLGLVGQTNGTAIVIENLDEALTRLQQGHFPLLPDYEIAGRVPADCDIHPGAHRPGCHVQVLRYHLPAGSQPHA